MPTEMQSRSENDFECLASYGVNAPVTMFPNSGLGEVQLSKTTRSLGLRSKGLLAHNV
jgi:hypothetical protein